VTSAAAFGVSDEEVSDGWLVYDASHRERSELGEKGTRAIVDIFLSQLLVNAIVVHVCSISCTIR
jgi:hypothetical protein